MFYKLALLIPLAALIGVNAQDTTSSSSVSLPTSGISPCILQCVTEATAGSSCQSFADIPCVCQDSTFQQNSLSCLQANCTSEDVAAATQLQQMECAGLGGGASGSGTAAPTSTGSGTQVPPNSSAISPSGTNTSGTSRPTGTTPSVSSPSTQQSQTSASTSNTGNSAVAVMLTSGPGALIASIVGLVGIVMGGGLVL